MPFTQTMPKLSPTMESGMIAKWHKKVGDRVEAGDLLIEVATDKATVEFNAIDSGYLRKILIPEGKEAIVNQPIAIFTEKKDESIEGYKPEGEEKPEAKVEEKKEAPKEAPAQPAAKPDAMAQPVFAAEPPLKGYTPPTESPEGQRILASPLARRLAKERELDLATVTGTGPNGRIMERDLEKAQTLGLVGFGRRAAPTIAPGTFELESMTPMRRVIAQRLQEAKSFIPHFYVTQKINAEPILAIREQLLNVELKVTFNDLIVRACALALKQHPTVNSGFDSVSQAAIRFKTIDIAVAVNVSAGLITPIVRHADYKNVGELSVEIRNLAKRAKEGKLEMHEYKGGSFTISNMGMLGVTDFSAIINPPQAAILAVSAILDEPVVRNEAVVPGKVMNLTLSVDHRVVDGAAAAEFMKTLQKLLENPAALLI
ncbi:MAG: pyruvate dehydrogenase complex dihydrolipoamide acetyltransferase [Parachlamydia sp.]|nr:pyruvate dehydrogenase complex dihydrolipoamide acetyltransferase [Parachlamydia sp.]